MKVIAFYLPQFHQIPENDKWWGKGFTEWTNVKKAVPRFKGHNEPRIPYKNNYYNLLNKDVIINQANIAKKFGIDAFCIYHYWFNGKKLLEKPTELLLKDKNINIEFCMSWANESWSRNWDGGNKELLLEQTYGNYDDWCEHYKYLSMFFNDNRYIKIDNKPVLIIYKPHLIKNCIKMIELWNSLAVKDGFDGIYLGYQHSSCYYNNFPKSKFSFGILFEPWYTIDSALRYPFSNKNNNRILLEKFRNIFCQKLLKKQARFSYENISKLISSRRVENNIMKCCFPDWDNTPRHTEDNNGCTIWGSNPEAFKNMVKDTIKNYNNDFLFINAWNEWGEGAYLEPDEKYKYGYLKAFNEAIIFNSGKQKL